MEGIELEKRKSLLEPERKIFSQRKQCELLGLARSGLYYRPREPSIEDLELKRAIDEQYLKTPFYGRRRMTVAMRQQGFLTGEKRIRTAMKQMGLEAIYPKPNLSKSNNEHTK